MDGTPTLRMNEFMLATLGAGKVDLAPVEGGELFSFCGLLGFRPPDLLVPSYKRHLSTPSFQSLFPCIPVHISQLYHGSLRFPPLNID